ncbi:hypothetical protein [Amycolatopsis kentuckyensis]|uniref:hypothetical protein n=1 Tax=Amycolatopsis kentuckyensis TaxID=218823 RepID=UPI003565DCF4
MIRSRRGRCRFWPAVSATKSASDLSAGFGLWFSDIQLGRNLRDTVTFGDGLYLRWLANSALYSVVGAAAATLLSAMAGYALAKFTFRRRSVTFSAILAGVLVPPTALEVPLFLMLAGVDMTNASLLSIIPLILASLALQRFWRTGLAAGSVKDRRDAGSGEPRRAHAVLSRLQA